MQLLHQLGTLKLQQAVCFHVKLHIWIIEPGKNHFVYRGIADFLTEKDLQLYALLT